MSVFKLVAKGGVVVSALIILNSCSSEELVENKYKKITESIEVEPKKLYPNKLRKLHYKPRG